MVTFGDISRLVYILHNTIIQIAFILVIDDILYQAIKGKALEEKTYCVKRNFLQPILYSLSSSSSFLVPSLLASLYDFIICANGLFAVPSSNGRLTLLSLKI